MKSARPWPKKKGNGDGVVAVVVGIALMLFVSGITILRQMRRIRLLEMKIEEMPEEPVEIHPGSTIIYKIRDRLFNAVLRTSRFEYNERVILELDFCEICPHSNMENGESQWVHTSDGLIFEKIDIDAGKL